MCTAEVFDDNSEILILLKKNAQKREFTQKNVQKKKFTQKSYWKKQLKKIKSLKKLLNKNLKRRDLFTFNHFFLHFFKCAKFVCLEKKNYKMRGRHDNSCDLGTAE